MTMAMISPSRREVSLAEQLHQSSRLVPPRFRLVAVESRPESLLMIFFSDVRLHIAEVRHRRPARGPTRQGAPRGVGRPPTLMAMVWAPSGIFFAQYIIINSKNDFRGVSGHLELCRIGL